MNRNNLAVRTVPIKTEVNKHSVQIESKDIEKGLKDLLAKVIELYGGKGELKVSKNFKRTKKVFCFKYKDVNENGKKLLNNVVEKVNQMEEKGGMWTFTQTITMTTVGS